MHYYLAHFFSRYLDVASITSEGKRKGIPLGHISIAYRAAPCTLIQLSYLLEKLRCNLNYKTTSSKPWYRCEPLHLFCETVMKTLVYLLQIAGYYCTFNLDLTLNLLWPILSMNFCH